MELILYLVIFYETLEGGEWGKVPKSVNKEQEQEMRECFKLVQMEMM